MEVVRCAVTVDHWEFIVHMHNKSGCATIETPESGKLELRPWTLGDHLAALAAGLNHANMGTLKLDPEAFAAEVLRRSAPKKTQVTAPLQSLALWWAAGGLRDKTQRLNRELAPHWIAFDDIELQLHPWSWASRTRALAGSQGPSGKTHVVTYIEAMLRTSVRSCRRASDGHPLPQAAIWSLTGEHALRLLEEVLACNGFGEPDEAWMLDDPTRAADTLWICQTLGWTPGQVWATPAHEIDRILQLRSQLLATSLRTTPQTGLASHPDAVVIHVEDL